MRIRLPDAEKKQELLGEGTVPLHGFRPAHLRESLRDIEACLGSQANLLYVMGIRGPVARTNLAYANEFRDWRVYFELAQILIRKARKPYPSDRHILEIDEMVYAIDASTIDLCMSLFP